MLNIDLKPIFLDSFIPKLTFDSRNYIDFGLMKKHLNLLFVGSNLSKGFSFNLSFAGPGRNFKRTPFKHKNFLRIGLKS